MDTILVRFRPNQLSHRRQSKPAIIDRPVGGSLFFIRRFLFGGGCSSFHLLIFDRLKRIYHTH
jgi:hypothetical protein